MSRYAIGTFVLSIGFTVLLAAAGATAQEESGASKRARRVPPMPHEKKAYDQPAEAASRSPCA